MQVLGRADKMSDFVLQGEAEGWIEITLSKDDTGRPITFRRHIRTRDESSDWKIDGAFLLVCSALGSCVHSSCGMRETSQGGSCRL